MTILVIFVCLCVLLACLQSREKLSVYVSTYFSHISLRTINVRNTLGQKIIIVCFTFQCVCVREREREREERESVCVCVCVCVLGP